MEPVLEAFERARATRLMPSGSAILLAVSGGADSMALLYGAVNHAAAAGWRLAVAHVQHGWRGREAERDLLFVREHARRLGLPFFWRRRDARREARNLKLSPEAGARHARYDALREMAREAQADRVATAHQRDDRVESYLLARQRGVAGPSLAGPWRSRPDGIVRPLLDVTREEILSFLRTRGIGFRRDSTNGDLRLARNRIRREVARMTEESGRDAIEEIVAEIERLERQRDRVERELGERVRPRIQSGPGALLVDAEVLETSPPDVARRAIDEMASSFTPPGRKPVTGRESEQILQRIASGGDFRFEAGRRIRIERRGRLLRIAPAPSENLRRARRGNFSPEKSVILKATVEKELSV